MDKTKQSFLVLGRVFMTNENVDIDLRNCQCFIIKYFETIDIVVDMPTQTVFGCWFFMTNK